MNLIEIESASTIIYYNFYVVARQSDVNASGFFEVKSLILNLHGTVGTFQSKMEKNGAYAT